MIIGRESRIQPPTLDIYSDTPLYNTKAVVHQTGVPAPTLRAWERRYGILTPQRGANDYRLYTERDMVTVAWLRHRVENGMTISQAIALLRSAEPARRPRGRTHAARVAEHSAPPAVSAAASPAVYSEDELRAALLHQCTSLDEVGATRTLSQMFGVYTVEEVCLRLLTPVLVELGQRWSAGELTVTVEHFASAVIRAQLDALFRSAASAEAGDVLLVGCAPGELHELGALMLALLLRRAGMHVAYVGQSVEPEGLLQTVREVRPACVLLSAALRPQAEALLALHARLRAVPGQRCYVGGQAFTDAPDLAEAAGESLLRMDAVAAVHEVQRRLMA